jgi:hypothetical protein
MRDTYQAVEVSAPGVLRVVERPIREPGAGQVRIRVEACGICHSDAATVTGMHPGLTLPRVPGHEVVGRIDAVGSGVSSWKMGQRVGVGFFGGEDGACEPCRRGNMVNCLRPVVPGVTADGGYAEVMIGEARGIAAIPDALGSVEAAGGLARIPTGRIVSGTRVNAGWSWHLEDVAFVEVAIELCDGRPSDVERQGATFGGGRFCPWTATGVDEGCAATKGAIR